MGQNELARVAAAKTAMRNVCSESSRLNLTSNQRSAAVDLQKRAEARAQETLELMKKATEQDEEVRALLRRSVEIHVEILKILRASGS